VARVERDSPAVKPSIPLPSSSAPDIAQELMMPRFRPVLSLLLTAAVAAGTGPAVAAADPAPSVSHPAAASATATSPGFATPDDAARAYLAALAQADVDGILSATAVDEMSAAFRFDLQADRVQAFQPIGMLGPQDDPLLQEIDRAQLTWQILAQARACIYGLLSDIDMGGTIVVPFGKEEADAFAAQVDTSRLAGVVVTDVRFPNPAFEHDPANLQLNARIATIYGADEITERVATFDFEGAVWQVGFTLIRYGDTWKVMNQTAPLSNLPTTGVPQRVSGG
jgi:hypothetical protein